MFRPEKRLQGDGVSREIKDYLGRKEGYQLGFPKEELCDLLSHICVCVCVSELSCI